MEEIVSGSQTETNETPERDVETEALYETFGIRPHVEKKDIVFPDMNQQQQGESDEPEDTPAIEENTESPKKLTVKYNKEDIEIDEEKIPEYVQKGLALDKQREIAKQRESDLDRAAKLLGLKDHAELTANFDRIEQERIQQEADKFETLKQQVIDELVNAGVPEETAKQYAENNPLVQQAKAAVEQSQQEQSKKRAEAEKQSRQSGWDELFRLYPHLTESAREDGTADWLTPEMQSRIQKGYDPVDAYRLAHAGTIEAQTKKAAEQKAIKAAQLGARGHSEGQPPANDEVSLLPAQMALAEEFGVSVKGIQRQAQLLKNRR